MSNNKQNMKLYTEEEVRKAIELAQECDHDGYYPVHFDYSQTQIFEHLTPIELPSDEEVKKQNPFVWGSHVFGTRDLLIWEQGATWMRDKIGGN